MAKRKVDLGYCLCLSTDGEVLVAERTPDFERYMPIFARPKLSKEDALKIRDKICDHYNEQGPDPNEKGVWLFRADMKTQMDLLNQFREAVEREAAKRFET